MALLIKFISCWLLTHTHTHTRTHTHECLQHFRDFIMVAEFTLVKEI